MAAGFTDGVLASPGLRDLVTVRRVDPARPGPWSTGARSTPPSCSRPACRPSVQEGRPATLTVVESGENPIAGQVARSLAEAYAAELPPFVSIDAAWPGRPALIEARAASG